MRQVAQAPSAWPASVEQTRHPDEGNNISQRPVRVDLRIESKLTIRQVVQVWHTVGHKEYYDQTMPRASFPHELNNPH
jgi:Zn-dependent M32 family carboxypeptidase